MLQAVGEINEDRGNNQKQKTSIPHWTVRDNVLHCIPWGEAASTDVQLVPDESGIRFASLWDTLAARFDTFHQAGAYMSLHVRSEQRSK